MERFEWQMQPNFPKILLKLQRKAREVGTEAKLCFSKEYKVIAEKV